MATAGITYRLAHAFGIELAPQSVSILDHASAKGFEAAVRTVVESVVDPHHTEEGLRRKALFFIAETVASWGSVQIGTRWYDAENKSAFDTKRSLIDDTMRWVLHKTAHGVLGGVSGYIVGGREGMYAGAVGAVVGEVVYEVMQKALLRVGLQCSSRFIRGYNTIRVSRLSTLFANMASVVLAHGFGLDAHVAKLTSSAAIENSSALQVALVIPTAQSMLVLAGLAASVVMVAIRDMCMANSSSVYRETFGLRRSLWALLIEEAKCVVELFNVTPQLVWSALGCVASMPGRLGSIAFPEPIEDQGDLGPIAEEPSAEPGSLPVFVLPPLEGLPDLSDLLKEYGIQGFPTPEASGNGVSRGPQILAHKKPPASTPEKHQSSSSASGQRNWEDPDPSSEEEDPSTKDEKSQACRGGLYGRLRRLRQRGYECHQMIPKACDNVSTYFGGAILMKTEHHRMTSSYGALRAARAFREQMRNLMARGEERKAMAMAIWDVRRIAGSEYNQAVQEMLKVLKELGRLQKLQVPP